MVKINSHGRKRIRSPTFKVFLWRDKLKTFQISISVVKFQDKDSNLNGPEFEAGCYFLIPVTVKFYNNFQ